jgi:PleD family two-component response regulator
MREQDGSFQYVLGKPLNKHYLLSVLMHALSGCSLLAKAHLVSSSLEKEEGISNKSKQEDRKGTLNVLLVDDNELCLKALKRLMGQYTQQITACEDGPKALATFKIARADYDLVLVDYQMPEMDGLTVIRSLRQEEAAVERKRRLKIICTYYA